MDRQSLIGINVVGIIFADGHQRWDDTVLLFSQKYREGVEEADLRLLSAHRFDGCSKGGTHFNLESITCHLGQTIGNRCAGFGDLASVTRRNKGDYDRVIRSA